MDAPKCEPVDAGPPSLRVRASFNRPRSLDSAVLRLFLSTVDG